jgi:hypothetical protein
MRGERTALRVGETLISLACRRLPARIRQERYQEWLAELPVILRDPGAGPAPVRVVRMLAFAADTLRGTALGPDAYRGAHRGAGARKTAAKSIRWLGTGLLLLGGLLVCVLFLLATEGRIIYQLATRPDLAFSVPLVLVNLGFFAASRTPRWANPWLRWYSMGKVVVGAGLSIRAIAGLSGWGHPLLFAIISYCGYAISVACLGMAVVQAVRHLSQPQHANQGPGSSLAGPRTKGNTPDSRLTGPGP